MSEKPNPLSAVEQRILSNLTARDRDIQREVSALRAHYADVIAMVEERAELSPGAIGTTHQLNLDAGCVEELPPAPEGES